MREVLGSFLLVFSSCALVASLDDKEDCKALVVDWCSEDELSFDDCAEAVRRLCNEREVFWEVER